MKHGFTEETSTPLRLTVPQLGYALLTCLSCLEISQAATTSTWQVAAGTTANWSDSTNWSSGIPGTAADTLRWNQNGSIINVDYNSGNPTVGYIYPTTGGQNLSFTNGVITLDDGTGNGWISPAGYTLTFNNILSATGAMYFNPDGWAQSGGTVILNKTNNWTGATYLARNVTILLGTDNALPTGTIVRLGGQTSPGYATLDLNGHSQTLLGLETTGLFPARSNRIINTGSTTLLTLNAQTNDLFGGVLGGSITVVKQGPGTLCLWGGTNVLNGTRIASNGTLAVVTGSTNPVLPVDGCALWLDATRGVTTNTGGNVTSWADQSGNGRNAINAGSSGPTVTTDINGLATLRFTRTGSQYLSCGIGALSNLSMFIVHSDWSISICQTYIGTDGTWRNDATYGNSVHLIQSAETPRRLNYAVFNANAWGTTSIPLNSTLLDEIIDSNGAYSLFLNGVPNGTGTQPSLKNLQNFRIGSWDSDASRYLDSSIGEILVFTNALSANDRLLIEGYLLNKWCGNTLMPADGADWKISTNAVMQIVGDLTLGSSNRVEIVSNSSTSGLMKVSGNLQLGGTLRVTGPDGVRMIAQTTGGIISSSFSQSNVTVEQRASNTQLWIRKNSGTVLFIR